MQSSAYCMLHADLDGAQNVDGSTMMELQNNFKIEISCVVVQLKNAGFFQNLDKLPKSGQNLVKDSIAETLPNQKWSAVLLDLTEVLHFLHKKPVIVLIDEYDSPMLYAAQYPYFHEVCLSSSRFMFTSHSLGRQVFFSARSSQCY